jgi:hypothetical protein
MGAKKSWINDDAEKLIDSVEIDGQSVQLDWHFNRQASRIDPSEIAFVYESASPKLRLTWEWKAAASTGPIEHTIHIENLEAKELWIPLQDSFQFKWRVDNKAALEHSYVEKGAGSPSAVGNASNGDSRYLSLERHVEHLRSPRKGRTSRNNSLVRRPEHSSFTKRLVRGT